MTLQLLKKNANAKRKITESTQKEIFAVTEISITLTHNGNAILGTAGSSKSTKSSRVAMHIFIRIENARFVYIAYDLKDKQGSSQHQTSKVELYLFV